MKQTSRFLQGISRRSVTANVMIASAFAASVCTQSVYAASEDVCAHFLALTSDEAYAQAGVIEQCVRELPNLPEPRQSLSATRYVIPPPDGISPAVLRTIQVHDDIASDVQKTFQRRDGIAPAAVEFYPQAITHNHELPNRKLARFTRFGRANALAASDAERRAMEWINLVMLLIRDHRVTSAEATELTASSYRALEYGGNMTALMLAIEDIENAARSSQHAFVPGEQQAAGDKLQARSNIDSLVKLRERDRDVELMRPKSLAKDFNFSDASMRSTVGFVTAAVACFLVLILFRSYRRQCKLASTKELFLCEIHHRTKNNLQLLTSLLSLDARRQEKYGGQAANGRDAANRVRTMAMVHDHIYNQRGTTTVDVKEFLDDLLVLLHGSLGQEGIELKGNISPLEIHIDKFTTLGLLVCELVTNSYKHAFDDYDSDRAYTGTISVNLSCDDERLHLEVADNGRGFDQETADFRQGSMGLGLIEDLAQQLGGQPEVNSGSKGTVWSIADIPAMPTVSPAQPADHELSRLPKFCRKLAQNTVFYAQLSKISVLG